MDREVWRVAVHRVTESYTAEWLNWTELIGIDVIQQISRIYSSGLIKTLYLLISYLPSPHPLETHQSILWFYEYYYFKYLI